MREITLSTQQFLNEFTKSSLTVDGVVGAYTTQAMVNFRQRVKNTFTKLGYSLSNVNLVAIRTSNAYTDRFTDWLVLVTDTYVYAMPASTKPGVASVYKNINLWVNGKNGVAVLKPGQYVDAYTLQTAWWSGLPFLYQITGEVTIYRDNNTDGVIDTAVEQTGYFGINIHSWSTYLGDFVSEVVGNLSEGCVVTKGIYMRQLVKLLETNADAYKRRYTLTLLTRDQLL
jgi:hypothetical protein